MLQGIREISGFVKSPVNFWNDRNFVY